MTKPNAKLTETLRQHRAVKRTDEIRIESEDLQVYAVNVKGRTDRWNIRRAGDNNDWSNNRARDKTFATIETRNRNAVKAVVDALAPFHRGDTL